MTVFIVVASVMFYVSCGALAAVRNLPRAWTEARGQWRLEGMTRNSVKARTTLMFLFWLFYIPGRAAGVFFGRVVDTGDPEAAARKVREQQRRIDQLEKDLGLR